MLMGAALGYIEAVRAQPSLWRAVGITGAWIFAASCAGITVAVTAVEHPGTLHAYSLSISEALSCGTYGWLAGLVIGVGVRAARAAWRRFG